MRSLLITFDYPPMVGGIATVFDQLWRRVGDENATILAPGGRGGRDFDAANPVRTVRFPALRASNSAAKLLTTFLGLAWFVYCVVRFRPDVVIAGQVVRAGQIAYLWSLVTRRPFYLWVYGGETSPEFTASGWTTRFAQKTLRGARRIFTIGPFTSDMVRQFGINADTIVELRLGRDERLSPRPKDPRYTARLGLDGKLVFLTVGRLIERKGIDTMLDALAGLGSEIPPWHYVIVSDGPLRETLARQATTLGIRDRVTFTGHVGDDELIIYYNLCDIFAMPNREVRTSGSSSLSVEGFGMVFIDAAACAKPVIVGRSGGAVDAVVDGVNGILVEPTSLQDVQRAIVRLADAPTRARMGAAGPGFAARFSWEAAAASVRPLLAGPPPPRSGA